MKKILVSLICCLTATLGWAQEKNAYTLFDAQGNRVDYTQMMDVLERQMSYSSAKSTTAPSPTGWNTKSSKTFTTGTATG